MFEPPPGEPSVLDWVKSILRARPIPIPRPSESPPVAPPPEPTPRVRSAPARPAVRLQADQVRLPLAVLLILIAQVGFEAFRPRNETPVSWIAVLLAGIGLLVWAVWRRDVEFGPVQEQAGIREEAPVRFSYLIAGALLSLLAFLLSWGNTFRMLGVIAWVASVVLLMAGFWIGRSPLRTAWERVRDWSRSPRVALSLDGWAIVFWLVLGLAGFFRFYQLGSLPLDMWSDQAEKLLDVMDVVNGRYPIFFLRNTGREPLQFYVAALTAKLLGTGVTFLTLKLGMALAGWLTLPFVYLFGREVGGRQVGLATMAMAGIAFWPNVISRTGLRFALLPLFAAPALFLIVRGIRRQSRNDFLLAGLCAGLGLYGYSPARVVPIAILVAVLIYTLHPVARGRRTQMWLWLAAAAVITLAVFVPLARAGMTYPDQFLSRSLTRLTDAERPLPGPALVVLLGNIWNALKMFNWDAGEIWVVALTRLPVLDWISGAMFLIGSVFLAARYWLRRNWLDLFVLISLPFLMAPSILAIAFPVENPAPNRAAGALIPAFTLAGFGLVTTAASLRKAWSGRVGPVVAGAFVLTALLLASASNYRMMFDDYAAQYRARSLNTGAAGEIVRGFAESVGSFATAHVVPFPHWFDTRLVGFEAGRPGTDYAVPREALPALAAELSPQLFLVHIDDAETTTLLTSLFPEGTLRRYASGIEERDFWIYFVPAREEAQ